MTTSILASRLLRFSPRTAQRLKLNFTIDTREVSIPEKKHETTKLLTMVRQLSKKFLNVRNLISSSVTPFSYFNFFASFSSYDVMVHNSNQYTFSLSLRVKVHGPVNGSFRKSRNSYQLEINC